MNAFINFILKFIVVALAVHSSHMWCCSCCQNCPPDKTPLTCTETNEKGKRKGRLSEDVATREFIVPKTRTSSLKLQNSMDSEDAYCDERKESNSSILSDVSSSYGFHMLGDVASVLETLQEGDTSQDEALDSIPEDNDGNVPEKEPPAGQLIFTMTYSAKDSRLSVFLERATDLPVRKTKKSFDSFVKVCLLPSKTNRLSRTIKNANNPNFQEDFTFQFHKKKQLNKRVLRFSLFDYERQGRHDAVGHVLLPLGDIRWTDNKRYILPLLPMSLPISNLGKILMSLFYLAEKDRLTVTIYRAANLRLDQTALNPLKIPMAVNTDNFQTYVKITLMCSGEKVKTERTATVSYCQTPVYNQSYHFIVPQTYLEDASVVVTVLAKGHLKQDAVIGRTVSGPYTASYGERYVSHWGEMVQERKPALKWRNLYL